MIRQTFFYLTLLGLCGAPSASATEFVVDTSIDTVADDGVLSLREAVQSLGKR